MRLAYVLLAPTFVAVMGLATPALADIPPRCKCSTPGVPVSGAAPVALVLACAFVWAARKRAR